MTCILSCASGTDVALLILAALVCAAGSWITIRVFARARASGGASRTGWIFLAGVPAGATIWTTHFIGMAGLQPNLQSGFDPALMIASLLIAFAATTAGFAIASSRRIRVTGEIGGAVVGLGICAMHYTGIAAFHTPGEIQLDPGLVALSIAVGAVMGAVALNRVIRPITCYCKYGAASALVLAICGMQIVGWSAMTIVPDVQASLAPAMVTSEWLVASIAGVGLIVIGTGASSYFLDDRSRAEAENRFHHLARHDTLTGLPNRVSFNERLDLNIALAKQNQTRLAVHSMNLRRLKEINDFFGYHAGDRVLEDITRRLSAVLENGEFLARLGGDEFAVIQLSDKLPDAAIALAQRMAATFEQGFAVGAKPLQMEVSIGVAVFPDDGVDRERLLANAEAALDRAREGGKDCVRLFESEADETIRRQRTLSRDLASAVERGEFEVFYQVQTAVADGAIRGFEALLRWRHATLGMISPVEFIPLAERSGLIVPIGEWVLRTACAAAAAWPQPHVVAINLSPMQLEQDTLPATIHQILLETGLPPGRLELEVTESTLMQDVDCAVHVLRRLKALGVSISIDDFGTGYSSLSTLQVFPFDKIKLDRSFLLGATNRVQRDAIVRAVISLGRSLSMKVLAEGVETADHLAFLQREGCDEAQGYFLGRPEPLGKIAHLVSGQRLEALTPVTQPPERLAG